MYQTYWNTSDYVCISSLPQQKLLWCRVTSYRLGYSHNVQSYICLLKKKMFVKSSPVNALCQVQNLNYKMKPNKFCQSQSCYRLGWRLRWRFYSVMVTSWNSSSNVAVSQDCYQIVTERKCATRRSRPWSKEADFFSLSKLPRKKLKIRSRAAVTGVVMAADVSPPPAGAALPVRLQVRPQDVDRGDG